jgi:hypothetical protein
MIGWKGDFRRDDQVEVAFDLISTAGARALGIGNEHAPLPPEDKRLRKLTAGELDDEVGRVPPGSIPILGGAVLGVVSVKRARAPAARGQTAAQAHRWLSPIRNSISTAHCSSKKGQLRKVENPGFPRGCARLAWRPGRQRRARYFVCDPRGIRADLISGTAVLE